MADVFYTKTHKFRLIKQTKYIKYRTKYVSIAASLNLQKNIIITTIHLNFLMQSIQANIEYLIF